MWARPERMNTMQNKNSNALPPAVRLLGRMAEEGEEFSILGDLAEEYHRRAEDGGLSRARCWGWGQVVLSAPAFLKSRIYWRYHMFKNYLKIAVRNFVKHRGSSLINLVGLAVGFSCCILIFLWIQDEMSYDGYHVNAQHLYRVYSETKFSDGRSQISSSSFNPLARLLRAQCPEVIEAGRIAQASNILARSGDNVFTDNFFRFVDPAIFRMFTFVFLKGDPKTVFDDPSSCVITEDAAKKYFGPDDPMGKILNVNNAIDVKVTGLIKNIPRQSDYRGDIFVPYRFFWGPNWQDTDDLNRWGGNPLETYVLLTPEAETGAAEQKMLAAFQKTVPIPPSMTVRLGLQPLSRVHLYNLEGGGLIKYITVFALIAVFVLFIACVNFINLTTARSGNRAKEVGLRKVVGAFRGDLIRQFFSESVLMAFLALVLALGMVWLALPGFSTIAGKKLSLHVTGESGALWGLIGVALLTGLLSGGYPALFLSSFQPTRVLKGLAGTGVKRSASRKILVVFQFSLSIFLIIATLAITAQLKFMRNKDLGYDREHLIYLNLPDTLVNSYESLKTELLRHPGILSVTRSLEHPADIGSSVWDADWDGKNPADRITLNFTYVDFDFFETFEMSLAEGRPFSREFATDLNEAYIVNEAAVKVMGIQNPVGKRLSIFKEPGKIIGVVKDFHFQPLRFAIRPMVIGMKPGWTKSNAFIRLAPGDIPTKIRFLENVWKKFSPTFPFQFMFYNDGFNIIYGAEMRMEKIVRIFTLLAVFISCLGLFGLASFMAEQRTKEIGIRKVLGASSAKIVVRLATEFTKWVIVANAIAWPLAFYAMNKWLGGYAYRIKLGGAIFAASGLASLAIALLTVSYQTLKAARTDPIITLKYE